jgi:MraZ protein
MALTGTYPRSLDDKKRLAIPRRLCDEFDEKNLQSLYISPGTDRSLSLFSPGGFVSEARKLNEQSRSRVEVRNYERLFYSRSEKVELDGQCRIRIPDRLAEFAGLEREVVLIGDNDHAEIWDAALWESFLNQVGPQFDSLANQAIQ